MTSSIPPSPETEAKFYKLVDTVWYYESHHPNMGILHDLYVQNKHRICKSPGSSFNHQPWQGGYIDHLTHMWDFTCSLGKVGDIEIPDVLLVIMLHDIEKPWKYVAPYGVPDLSRFRYTTEQHNALKYTHGEGNDYTKNCRVMGELAALVHMADVWSARVLHSTKDRT